MVAWLAHAPRYHYSCVSGCQSSGGKLSPGSKRFRMSLFRKLEEERKKKTRKKGGRGGE